MRLMFDLAVNHGLGGKSIMRELNRRQIPAPRGPYWNSSTVATLLDNPVYVGDQVWFKTKRVGRDGRERTDPVDRVITTNAHPPSSTATSSSVARSLLAAGASARPHGRARRRVPALAPHQVRPLRRELLREAPDAPEPHDRRARALVRLLLRELHREGRRGLRLPAAPPRVDRGHRHGGHPQPHRRRWGVGPHQGEGPGSTAASRTTCGPSAWASPLPPCRRRSTRPTT